jgi:hypothetical protein
MSEQEFVVSMKVKDLIYRTPGSILAKCADCDADVSLAPSSQKFIAEHPDIQILCAQCAVMRANQTDEKIEVIPLNSKQETEIRDFFRRN